MKRKNFVKKILALGLSFSLAAGGHPVPETTVLASEMTSVMEDEGEIFLSSDNMSVLPEETEDTDLELNMTGTEEFETEEEIQVDSVDGSGIPEMGDGGLIVEEDPDEGSEAPSIASEVEEGEEEDAGTVADSGEAFFETEAEALSMDAAGDGENLGNDEGQGSGENLEDDEGQGSGENQEDDESQGSDESLDDEAELPKDTGEPGSDSGVLAAEGEAQDDGDGSLEMGAAEPSVRSSSGTVSLLPGDREVVNISCHNVSGYGSDYGLICKILDESIVSLQWVGGWNQSINGGVLRIIGKKTGSTVVTAYMYRLSSGKILASTSILVKVEGANTFKVSDSSLTIPHGENRSLIVSGANFSSGFVRNVSYNSSYVSVEWYGNTFNSGGYNCRYLRVTGKRAGTTTLTIRALHPTTRKELAVKYVTVKIIPKPSITAGVSTLTLKQNNRYGVSFSINNYSGSGHVDVICSNSNCSVSMSGISNNKGTVYVTGKSPGSTKITLRLFSADNSIVTTTYFYVTVQAADPSLTASSTVVSLKPGLSSTVTITGHNFTGSASMSLGIVGNCCKTSWGSPSGSNIPLTITATQTGTARINVYLKQNGKTLATTTISVAVASDAKVTLSATSVSPTVGGFQEITVGYSNAYVSSVYFSLGVTGSSCSAGFSTNWSNHKRTLRITGKSSGSATVRVYLRNAENDSILAYGTIYVNVKNAAPFISVQTSLTMNAGYTRAVTVNYGGYPAGSTIKVGVADASKCRVTMPGSGGTSSLQANIIGTGYGSTGVYFYLCDANGKSLASGRLGVTVNGTGVSDLSYTFVNSRGGFGYSSSYKIPLQSYQLMFGKTQLARDLYDDATGWGGNCFGMSTTSSMFRTTGNTVLTTSYKSGATRPFDLSLSNYNFSDMINLKRFIEGMQLSQKCYYLQRMLNQRWNNLSGLYSAVKNIGSSQPVVIGIWGQNSNGQNSAHAVLAYGVEEGVNTTKIYVYDPNYPDHTGAGDIRALRHITLYKNAKDQYVSWLYEQSENVWWGTGRPNAGIAFFWEAECYTEVWLKRGTLSTSSMNLLCANSDDLNIYDVEDNLIAAVENGELTMVKNEELAAEDEEILVVREMDESQDGNLLMYLPTDFYQIKNTDASLGTFQVSMTNEYLGAKVTTTGNSVAFAVDDDVEGLDGVSMNTVTMTPEPGTVYEIRLNSAREEDPQCVAIAGAGSGVEVSASMDNGELVLDNMDMARVDAGDTFTGMFQIQSSAGEGGTISPAGIAPVSSGGCQSFKIAPQEGYEIADVLVDGVSVGAVDNYVFTGVTADHTIEARFTHEHRWDEGTVDVAPTCGMDGSRTCTCTICGETKTEVIPRTEAHTYGGWETTKESTVLETGARQRRCAVCQTVETEMTDPLPAVMEINASTVKLQKNQKTTGLTVTMGKGDEIASVRSAKPGLVKAEIIDAAGGRISLKATKKTGTAQVTITLESGLEKTVKVKVQKNPVKTTGITVPEKTVTLKKGETSLLRPVVKPFTSKQKVTFRSSNKKVASVTAAGKITAKKKGTAKITVKSGSKKVVVTVKVK